MELSELGIQYLETAVRLSERLHMLTKQCNTSKPCEQLLLKRRISALYADIAECRRCAGKLINYRSKGE